MKKEYFFISIFFGLVVLSFYLFYKIMAPFLVSLCWAAIFVGFVPASLCLDGNEDQIG